MNELTFQKQAEYWGQAYEVLVKRGVLAYLVEAGLIHRNRPGLKRWRELQLLEVSKQLYLKLDIIDHAMHDVVSAAVRHLSFTAYGVGYTARAIAFEFSPRCWREVKEWLLEYQPSKGAKDGLVGSLRGVARPAHGACAASRPARDDLYGAGRRAVRLQQLGGDR